MKFLDVSWLLPLALIGTGLLVATRKNDSLESDAAAEAEPDSEPDTTTEITQTEPAARITTKIATRPDAEPNAGLEAIESSSAVALDPIQGDK